MKCCTICAKRIVLVPSAEERAAKTGQPAAHFTALFTTHSDCSIEQQREETAALIRKLGGHNESH